MDIDALTDDDLDQLASQLAGRLPTGRYGGQFVLSRRQLLSLAGGSAGVAGLVALGVDPATAQSAAGQVGTASSPEDVFAFDLDVQNGAEFNGTDLSGVGSLSTEQADVDKIVGAGAPYSVTDDFSDVTIFSDQTDASSLTFEHINVSGSGVFLGGLVVGYNIADVTFTVDGGSPKSLLDNIARDVDGTDINFIFIPSINYDSSLLVEVTTGNSTTAVSAQSYIQ